MATTEHRFDVGDPVFQIYKTRKRRKRACSYCSERGTLTGDNGHNVDCPACEGQGCVDQPYWGWSYGVAEPVIAVFKLDDGLVRYQLDDSIDVLLSPAEADVVGTAAEADAECKRRAAESKQQEATTHGA